MLFRSGRNYFAQDFERAVASVPNLLPGAVVAFGIEGGAATRIVIMAETRVRDEAAKADLQRRIRQVCQEAFDVGPDDVRLLAPGAIPRTTSGKVRRQACRQAYEANVALPGTGGGEN